MRLSLAGNFVGYFRRAAAVVSSLLAAGLAACLAAFPGIALSGVV